MILKLLQQCLYVCKEAHAEITKHRARPQTELEHKPLQWWKEHKSICLTLSKLSNDTPCIVATSFPSEYLFSVSGNFVSQESFCLSPQYAERLIFYMKPQSSSPRLQDES